MTKRLTLKKIVSTLCVLALCLGMMSGCAAGSTENTTPVAKSELAQVSNFTFDFESGADSFAGVENAAFYYLKVLSVTDGVESVTAVVQSDKIDANTSNSYTGTVSYEFLAGDYTAQVMAAGSGYKSSYTKISGSSTLQGKPTVSANWKTEDDVVTGAEITITAVDAITKDYKLTVTNEAGDVVYSNDHVPAGALNLTVEDFGVEALTVDDVYNVTVTVNQVSGYTAPAEGVTAQIQEQQSSSGGPGGGPGGPGGSEGGEPAEGEETPDGAAPDQEGPDGDAPMESAPDGTVPAEGGPDGTAPEDAAPEGAPNN